MYAWLREHAAEERKPKDTEEQFIYKARKKAHRARSRSGCGTCRPPCSEAIGQSLEERFAFLMRKLAGAGHGGDCRQAREAGGHRTSIGQAEIVAAGGTISAAEKKAEGLAD